MNQDDGWRGPRPILQRMNVGAKCGYDYGH
jgi:hypothetical protein